MTARASLGALVVVLGGMLAACGSADRSSPTAPSAPASTAAAAFVLIGDPESSQGATWTYKGSLGGVVFDLEGILLKPVTRWAIERGFGMLKRKPGGKSFNEEWTEHKREERELEDK